MFRYTFFRPRSVSAARTCALAIVVTLLAVTSDALAGKSKTTDVSMWRVEFKVDSACKVESSDRMTRITDESGENKIWITYQGSYSGDANYSIGGRPVDGDSPNNVIEAVVDQDAERCEKVLRKGKARKQKTRSKATVYYAVIDAIDKPVDVAPTAEGGFKLGTPGEPEKMKIYHLIVRSSNSSNLEHVVIRTTNEDHKVTSKWIRGIILSMST